MIPKLPVGPEAAPWATAVGVVLLVALAAWHPGLAGDHHQRHDPATGALFEFALAADGRLLGASGFGPRAAIGRDIRAAQNLIEQRACPDPAQLADPAVKLRSLLD